MRNKFIVALVAFITGTITGIFAIVLWPISLIFMIAEFIESNKENKLRQKIIFKLQILKLILQM